MATTRYASSARLTSTPTIDSAVTALPAERVAERDVGHAQRKERDRDGDEHEIQHDVLPFIKVRLKPDTTLVQRPTFCVASGLSRTHSLHHERRADANKPAVKKA